MRYAFTLAALALLALAQMASPAGVPTGVLFDIIDGTPFDDVLDGTDGYDELRGYEGNDELRGFGGPDNLWGGDQGDFLKGGGGDDALYGGQGPDDMNSASDDSGGDFVSCGDGEQDHVRANPADAVALNCEDVTWVNN